MKNVEYIGRLLRDIGVWSGEIDQRILSMPRDTDPDIVLEEAFGPGMNRKKIVQILEKNMKEKDVAGNTARSFPLLMQMVEERCGDPLGQFLP